jgi:transcription termination factor Rho
MSDELPLDDQPTKPKKKAATKKVAAKKVAVKAAPTKKVAAKKTAAKKAATKKVIAKEVPVELPVIVEAPVEKPARKSAASKKAAAMLATLQKAESQAAAPAPAPAPPVEPAPQAPLEVQVAPVVIAAVESPAPVVVPEPLPAAVVAPETVASAPEVPTPSQPAAEAPRSEGQPQGEDAPQERRKSKFERWKERRERFRQEKIARRLAAEGKGPPPSEGQPSGNRQSSANNHFNNEDDRPRISEAPLGPPEPADGVLELTPKGYGFLRQRERMYAQHPNDAFISGDFIRQYGLREGMYVKGISQKGPRGPQITSVAEVNGRVPESMRDLPLFEELKAINPNKKIQLETRKDRFTTRVIDMFTPVGRGQRGLIVAPPRAGKTTLLQHIAEAVVENHPGMHLMILLVDERPEEVTEFKRILPKAEIYASSNDQDVKSHTRIAAFAIERAKRLVECGEHVFMLMDSITRLARAFNNAKQGGATMSGGMGVGAMEIPRRLFAAARNTRGAGSLTVLATALIETGSRMDDLIFQEFKGTGNMELVLDRKIAEQFYYPAVNIFKSGTRREELLLQPFQLDKIHMLRRGLAGHKPIDAIQRVLQLMERYPSNAQMLVDLPSKSS